MRIDTQALYRGRLAKIIVLSNNINSIFLKGWNYLTKELQNIDYEIISNNNFSEIKFIAPQLNGVILCRINNVPLIKKVGYLENILIFHYKKGYDIPYILYGINNSNLIKKSGKANNIIDEFYYIDYSEEDVFVKLFNKNLILNKQKFITNYDIIMDGEFSINSNFDASISDAEIGDIKLGEANIKDVDINVEIPNVKIKEY